MFKILYGEVNPFDGLAPTPLISRDVACVHYGRKSHDVERITLHGTMTGLCESPEEGDFQFFWNRAQQLYSNFSKPFQSLRVIEDLGSGTGVIYAGAYAIPRSIDIDDNNFAYIVPFTVNLDVFDEETFTDTYGVVEPDQDISFVNNEDGTVTLTKTTSARGFNTSEAALTNAINYVQGLTGLDPSIAPLFINASGLEDSILISVKENINRLDGTYSVDESWLYDIAGRIGAYSTHRIRTSIEESDIGIRVSVEGDLTGSHGSTIAQVRSDFTGLDPYAEAQAVYESFGFSGELFTTAIRKEITEDTSEKNISFSFQYNDSIATDPYIIDSISVVWDSETNKHCASASVSIRSTDSCRESKWTKVKNYYDNFNIVEWIDARLDELGYDVTLPNKPKSESVSFNEKSATINVSASLCEKKIIVPDLFADFSYSVQITPAMPIFVPFQGLDCGGSHTVQKLNGSSRKTLSIQGEGTILPCASKEDAEESLKDYINGIKLNYLSLNDTFLSSSSIRFGTGSNDKKLYFSFSWNENDELIFDDTTLSSLVGGVSPASVLFNGEELLYNGENITYNGE